MNARLFSSAVAGAVLVMAGVAGCDRAADPVDESKSGPKPMEKPVTSQPASTPVPKGISGGGLEQLSEMLAKGRLTDEGLEMLEVAVENDPSGSAEWAVTLPPGADRDTCLEIVFYDWGGSDSTAALNFIRERLRGMDRTLAAASAAEAIAEESPEAASAALALVAEPIPRGIVIESIVSAGVAESPARVASWVLALSNPYERETAMAALGAAWSDENPQACAEWIASNLNGEERTNATLELMANWGASSPRDAARWLASQRAAAGYMEGGEELADAWAMVDPRAAANWAMQETDPETRGIFVDTVLMNWVLNEAADSIDWANGIQNPDVRAAALETAFVALDAEAPAALDYWLESHPSHAAREIALSVREADGE